MERWYSSPFTVLVCKFWWVGVCAAVVRILLEGPNCHSSADHSARVACGQQKGKTGQNGIKVCASVCTCVCLQSLSHCELITDDGIRHLGSGPCAHDRLEVIELDNCPLITDASLEHLKSCHSLDRIELYDCQQITRAGIKRLRVSGRALHLSHLLCGGRSTRGMRKPAHTTLLLCLFSCKWKFNFKSHCCKNQKF